MNPANLSASEVLRMCQPETELERRLFDLVSGLYEEVLYFNTKPEQDCDCDECEDCDESIDSVRAAVDLIESGRIDDAIRRLKALI